MKIPDTERIMVSYSFNGVVDFVCTGNALKVYTLYSKEPKGYKKLKTSNNPLDFDKIIEKHRRKIYGSQD